VGGIFGVGFLREYLEANHARLLDEIREHHVDDGPEVVDAFLEAFDAADVTEKGTMLADLKKRKKPIFFKKERRELRKMYHKELVKRSMLLKIAAAWVITVPLAGVLAAMLYFMIRGMLLPH